MVKQYGVEGIDDMDVGENGTEEGSRREADKSKTRRRIRRKEDTK